MSKEAAPLQYEMFTSELVDNRTRTQKQVDRASTLPLQAEMFSQREIAQFGVHAKPQMSLSPHTKLVLIAEDPRTPEEIEWDREKEAQALTSPLFEGGIMVGSAEEPQPEEVPSPPRPLTLLTVVGYRARIRQASIQVRTRRKSV